jgi:AbrB family looped-hinge helix DNA binding protein
MLQSVVTSKGQTTIPKEIRKLLKLKPKDRLFFLVEEAKVILKSPWRRRLPTPELLRFRRASSGTSGARTAFPPNRPSAAGKERGQARWLE